MTLTYIYQSTHSISFPLSALTHSISLPCKMDGKEGQSVDVDFWHPIESISHQHWCSKFLMKSRIIWSNYDHNQKSTIKDSRLHLIACNRNQRFALHALHVMSFHASFHVISCRISHHFISHFIHFIAHITRIAHTSRMSRISHFANSVHFMHYTIHHVILCIISCHFFMKIHITLIHTI